MPGAGGPSGKAWGGPVAPPSPPGCVSVCSVLVACGNWAQAQGELTVQTQDGSGGRVREGRDEAGWTQNRGLFVFPGGAELGPCTSHVSSRAQAAKKPGIVGGLRHPHGPSAPAGENSGPLKDRMSDPSQCEQVYSGGGHPISGCTDNGETQGPPECMTVENSVLGAQGPIIPLRPPRPCPGPACLGSGQAPPAGWRQCR